ncbi:glycerophosphodiester phosphodiesterase family protein [Pelagicoccus albus]|uniref:Glycerophosphodiester phosphodiesterase n=1 Tax=Pelagicoccus albus TaxID=415222 RepID=A0A7X1B997_9BACT|nr:glycerophosphodiester phosphodiesterase [Pelagicoccus albus]
MAHRGASAYAPENTLPSFELAWEMGADAIEGDFQLTVDGHVVCVHDYSIERYTGIDRRVVEMTLSELRALDFGSWKGGEWIGVSIATLEEVLSIVPSGKMLYLEIKSGPEIVPELLKQVAKARIKAEQLVFISFDQAVVTRLKREAPELVVNWLVSLESNDGVISPAPKELLQVLKLTGADGIGVEAIPDISAEFVAAIRGGGWAFHVWTVDQVALARKLAQFGSKSITTNKPDLILRALRRD